MRSTSPHIRANHEQYPKSPADRQNPHHLRGWPRHRRRPRRQAEHPAQRARQPRCRSAYLRRHRPAPHRRAAVRRRLVGLLYRRGGHRAKEKQVTLPAGTAVEVEVDLGLGGGGEFHIQARLTLVVPGLDHALATTIAHAADAMCPYSKATRGNIDVVLSVATA